MPRAKKSPAKSAAKAANGKQNSRLWLMYPPKLIKTPIIWELGHKFPLVTNIRQVSVTDEIGIVCLELEGERAQIKSAILWLEKQGIRVEPVEINVIES
ncbi:MAG TPA: NIL domain-containing protein [Pyrinomonadaceae bacterium]|nr:NIL domain-containing protein [Pyrinomonadaceae bacterium]